MWLNPFPDIWREDPAHIPIPGDAAAALARVRERAPRWPILVPFREAVVGRVDGDRVRLRRYRPFRRAGSQMLLDASLRRDGPVSALIGVYRERRDMRAFGTFWFAFVLLMIPALLTAAIPMWSKDRESALAFTIFPTLLLLMGRAAFAWHHRRWAEDKLFIERFLADCCAEPTR